MIKEHQFHSRIYLNFFSIDQRNYLGKVLYFENKEREIEKLTVEEKYPLTKTYIEALFALRSYTRFIQYATDLCPATLDIQLEPNPDYYPSLLFKQAVSLYHTNQLNPSIHLLTALIKMGNRKAECIIWLRKAVKKRIQERNTVSRSVLVTITLVILTLYAISVLWIAHFYPEINQMVLKILQGLMGAGVLFMVFTQIINYKKTKQEMKALMTKLPSEDEHRSQFDG